MMAMLEAFEAEARHWCGDRGIDPDGSAPGIMVGPLGFAPEKYWIRCATVIPAKPGIHFSAPRWWQDGSRLSPG